MKQTIPLKSTKIFHHSKHACLQNIPCYLKRQQEITHLQFFEIYQHYWRDTLLFTSSQWFEPIWKYICQLGNFPQVGPRLYLAEILYTPPKFNMESENDGFRSRSLLFQGLIFRWTMLNLRGVYTWNPNDLYFWRLTPQNKAFSNQNKCHLGSRYSSLVIATSKVFSPSHPWQFPSKVPSFAPLLLKTSLFFSGKDVDALRYGILTYIYHKNNNM